MIDQSELTVRQASAVDDGFVLPVDDASTCADLLHEVKLLPLVVVEHSDAAPHVLDPRVLRVHYRAQHTTRTRSEGP